mmetsp:Transcript_50648/g.156787  ORF Transcript_50648/g.156787 Transcript_50648/m.156787 type:complete len:453 (+) Transcript_50648:39-1397(+)
MPRARSPCRCRHPWHPQACRPAPLSASGRGSRGASSSAQRPCRPSRPRSCLPRASAGGLASHTASRARRTAPPAGRRRSRSCRRCRRHRCRRGRPRRPRGGLAGAMWDDDEFQCMSCPNTKFTDREVYAKHVQTKWHMHNLNCAMMGTAPLTEEAFLLMTGEAPKPAEPVAGKDGAAQAEQEQEAAKEAEKQPEDEAVTVVIMFSYQEEKWSHRFSVKKGTTVWELKQSMVKPGSPEDDLVSFNLKKGMIRVWNFDTIESDDTFEFQYCGPEEGQRFLDRDNARKDRDEAEARARMEEETRRNEERKRQDEERWRAEEERKQKEEEEKSRQEAEKRQQEEDWKNWVAWQEEQQRLEAERQAAGAEAAAPEAAAAEKVEVMVHIDRALNLRSTVTVDEGSPVLALKAHLAKEDPTGQVRPEDLVLVDADSGEELQNDALINNVMELDLQWPGA